MFAGTSVALTVLYVVLAPRIGRGPVIAFAVGYLSHSLADLPFGEVAKGQFEFATYLLWPLLQPSPHIIELPFIAHATAYEFGPFEVFQWVLFGVAIVAWYFDGMPGVEPIRARVRR